MAGKRKRRKQPNLRSRIVNLIIEKGPMKLRGMVTVLKASYQSLNTEALEMRRLGLLLKDAEGVWSLAPGVNPAMFGIETNTTEVTIPAQPQPESSRTLHDDFKDLLRSVGVKLGADEITDIYFSGDHIWNAHWLHRVLTKEAAGFVNEDQCKIIMRYWTRTTGIPYRYEDFFED